MSLDSGQDRKEIRFCLATIPTDIVTLCTYALQGHVFGCIGLCMCACLYDVAEKLVVWDLTACKSPIIIV